MSIMRTTRVIALLLSALLLSSTAPAAVDDPSARGSGYIKPSGPVQLRYRLLGEAVAGVPVDLEIVLRPEREVQSLDANLEARRGMAVTRRGALERINGAVTGGRLQAFRQVITLVPEEEGLHHVYVFASVRVDGELQTRIVSVPVQVGRSTKVIREPAPPNGELTVGADGEPIMTMKAAERIQPVGRGPAD